MIQDYELPVFTFGWELEATGRAHRPIKDVQVGHDGSVGGDGLEYRIRREAVYDPERSLTALRALCASPGLKVDRSCGFHVHVGLGIRTRKLQVWAANFVTLARLLERDVFQVVPPSRRDNRFCCTWQTFTGPIMSTQYSGSKHSNATRYCWVNPVEIFRPGGIRTIEIRLMGDTQNYLYMLAWTSFCRRMAASAWALVHDPSRLEQETTGLREALKMIRDCFVVNTVKGLNKAKAVTLLAAKAGFYGSLAPSLNKLKEKEKTIRWEMDHEAEARDNYMDTISYVRSYIERERQSLSATHSETALGRGDIVEALVSDGSGYTVPGRRYIVVDDNPEENFVRIENHSGGWNTPRELMRFAERRSEACVV